MVTLRIYEIEVSKRLNESVTMRNTEYWKIHSTILKDIHIVTEKPEEKNN